MTTTAHPTPPEHPDRPEHGHRSRAERARLRAQRRATRRAVRRELVRARRTHQPTPPPSPAANPNPSRDPITDLHEHYATRTGTGKSTWLAHYVMREAERGRGVLLDPRGEHARQLPDQHPASSRRLLANPTHHDHREGRDNRDGPDDWDGGGDEEALPGQLWPEIKREHREGMYLTGMRLIMFTLLIGISLAVLVHLLATAQPAGPTTRPGTSAATARTVAVRSVAVSTPHAEPSNTSETTKAAMRAAKPTETAATAVRRLTAPAQAATPATSAPQPAHTASAPIGPKTGALAFAGPHDPRERCATRTARDERGSVVQAGPVKVSIAGVDLPGLDALTDRCDGRATARPSRSSDHDSGRGSDGRGSDKDKNRNNKNRNNKNNDSNDRGCDDCANPDPRDWPGWHGDGLGPNSGYGYSYGPGYGPDYDRYYREDRSHQRTHRFDRHSRGGANDPGTPHRDPHRDSQRGQRSDTGAVCRVAPPGLVRGLPDGGVVCRRATTPRTRQHNSPKANPDSRPDSRPKVTPHIGQETGPNTSPKPGPDTSQKPRPDTRPKASPTTRPAPKPNGPAQTSPKANPDTKPQPAPRPAPTITPNDLDHAGGGTNKYGF